MLSGRRDRQKYKTEIHGKKASITTYFYKGSLDGTEFFGYDARIGFKLFHDNGFVRRETAFRSAINKMRDYLISRLDTTFM